MIDCYHCIGQRYNTQFIIIIIRNNNRKKTFWIEKYDRTEYQFDNDFDKCSKGNISNILVVN